MTAEAAPPPFDVRSDRSGSGARITVEGELDLVTEPRLVTELERALSDGGAARLVVDLTAVDFIDSAGLRSLLLGRDRARQLGSQLVLAVRPGPVTRLLDVAGVASWFAYE